QYAAPVAVIAAIAVGVGVTVADREPKVHFTLTKLNVPPAATQAVPANGQAAAPASGQNPASRSNAAAAAPATPAPSPTPAVAAGPLHFVVNQQSQAAYTVHEKLTRLPAPSDAIGKTNAIKGDVYLIQGQGLAPNPPSVFTVDLTTLTSDAAPRDRFIKQNT